MENHLSRDSFRCFAQMFTDANKSSYSYLRVDNTDHL